MAGWEGGSTRRWRKLRATILERDGHECQLRIPGTCTGHATHVHHTHGKDVTGDDPAYLVASCGPCNLKTGQPGKADPQPQPRTRW